MAAIRSALLTVTGAMADHWSSFALSISRVTSEEATVTSSRSATLSRSSSTAACRDAISPASRDGSFNHSASLARPARVTAIEISSNSEAAAEEIEVPRVRMVIVGEVRSRIALALPRAIDATQPALIERRPALGPLPRPNDPLVHHHQHDENRHRHQRRRNLPERDPDRHGDQQQPHERGAPLAQTKRGRFGLAGGEVFGVQIAHRGPF